jgi:tetratricopeptide (TPR) repeat protein
MRCLRLCAAFLPAILLAPASPLAAELKTVADYLELARQKELSLDFTDAVDLYDAVLEQHPKKFPYVYALRGEDLGFLGYDKEAIADFTEALALDDADPKGPSLDHADILTQRAEIKRYAGDPDGALADYSAALKLDPKNEFIYMDRAELKLVLGDCAGAVADYTSTLEYYEKPGSIPYEGRAIARICTGALNDAFEDYRTALQKDKELDAGIGRHVFHGTFLHAWALMVRLGRKDDADAQLTAQLAAAGKPDGTDSQYDAGRYLLGQVDQTVLFSDAAASTAKQPEFGEANESTVYFYIALKAMAAGDKAGALTTFQKVLAYDGHMVWIEEAADAWIKDLKRQGIAPAPAAADSAKSK